MDAKHTHLEIINGVVNRLSNNSFLLKGWSVVLVSGLFALAAKEAKHLYTYIAYFPCIVFWGLDGYFLWQERLFRRLYDKVRIVDPKDIDYSLQHLEPDCPTWVCFNEWRSAVFSKTLIAFHGAILVTIVIVMFALK